MNNILENYSIDDNGLIYQIKRNEFVYDKKYIDKGYSSLKESLSSGMSHVRFSYLLTNIGHIPSSILDIGYGNGNFLKTAQKIIKDCRGFDIPPAFPISEEIQIVRNPYESEVEVVTFFDSLEHFPDIYEIKNLKCKFILISVPWCHYLNDDWFSNWKHRKPDEHLWHFNHKSLIKFMQSIGFKYITHSNIEDCIRKPYDPSLENILTALFVRE